ncbi:MAG: hypothetical protein LUO95_06220 [Methylococcaceae bacterium]|nr:hypothetical protein [Methylococcaceae bacterium]MDD1610197.1 hypothetical protein [Methylococcaceae bacterium]MDD1615315.1 hypothetical protein [Methylococcaceae bacterium]OYV20637.1 MAG: hypothetical protein CG439_381 [Methylococcaceae bacterium NSP1-2]
MKTIIILLLLSVSSLAMAEDYSNPLSTQDRLRIISENINYTPAQTRYFIEQQRVNDARRNQVELEQAEANRNRMIQYYKDRRDTERFIGD